MSITPAVGEDHGQWEFDHSQDIMDDTDLWMARLQAKEVIDGPEDVFLQLECHDGTEAMVWIEWHAPLYPMLEGLPVVSDIEMRFGDYKALHLVWSVYNNSQVRNTPNKDIAMTEMMVGMTAIFVPELKTRSVGWTYTQFITALSISDQIIARTQAADRRLMTAIFDTTGKSAAVNYIKEACPNVR